MAPATVSLHSRAAASALALLAAGAAAPAAAQEGAAASGPALTEVATFDHQVTGVTVSEDGRIFVNFPRWSEDSPVSVAEVVDGEIKPYPNDAWNSWRNAKKNVVDPATHFVSVQSVVADGRGSLWVLDPAAPATAFLVPDGPKLVKIDLSTNEVTDTVPIGPDTAPQGTYLNDVRFSPDGSHAFITDSGPDGALIVVDLGTKEARRFLSGHPFVKADPTVVVKHHGDPIHRPDGRGVEFSADGIALSPDGQTLYWQALTGRKLYSVSTSVLEDPSATDETVAAAVKDAGNNGVSDGLWMDGEGRMYISALQEDAIKRRDADGQIATILRDERLRWPDTFSQGPNGRIYVTSSRIMDMSWYKPESPIALQTQLWSFDPGDGDASTTSSTTPEARPRQ
jgi:sugar lactone lactonase YvrE